MVVVRIIGKEAEPHVGDPMQSQPFQKVSAAKSLLQIEQVQHYLPLFERPLLCTLARLAEIVHQRERQDSGVDGQERRDGGVTI